jgi:hypothetical protein
VITLAFDGWAEVRLATDPDPSDEPRGVSGFTFAVAGEPDLDRIIRLQPAGAVARMLGPAIGVAVRAVSVGDATVARHPLAGAVVDLLGDPVFEGRNGIVGEDAREPIVPFHIAVRSADGGVALQREHRAAGTGELLPAAPSGFAPGAAADITAAMGGLSSTRFRLKRLHDLEAARAGATEEVAQVALDKRIRDIDDNVGDGIAEQIMDFALRYVVVLDGPSGEVSDPAGALGGTIGLDPWTVDLWFGAFDCDTLCMFVKGTLELPFEPAG